ncbi:MAG: sigma-70 family RNA polymerase sigma factor [Phycisphaerales bacterium JB052]
MGYLKITRLIRRAQANDLEAYQELWVRNARLCYTVANKIRVRRDLVADLIQESQEAFPKAIRNFDINRLLEFSTYAHAAIRSHMIRALSRIRFSTRIPSQLYGPLIRYLVHLENAPDRSHWYDERERMIHDGHYERVRDLHAIANPYSLLEAKHTRCPQPSPQEAASHRDEAELLYRVSLNLSDRDRFILVHRYGLWGRPEMTLQQLGDILGVTRERVRQLQLIAEQQLRSLLTETGLNQTRDSETHPLS